MPTIAIICFDGFTDIDVFLPWDLFNRPVHAGLVKDGTEWHVRLLGTADRHVSRTGLSIAMHGRVEEAADANAVMFASGFVTRALHRDPAYLARFAGLDPARQVLTAQCSGSLILGALGHLHGRRATTYAAPDAIARLAELGATYVNDGLVVDGPVATAAGCLANADLVGWVVTRLAGPELAAAVLAEVAPNPSQGAA
ncbi:MAG: DJ-1/PfpI family protein [Niveispirillum sp.]|uniref:DJ-1/PfpI family protein n=1 Tax=Niveispirillum sp. TaxID=1917217 RepID=UPI004035F4CC